MNGNTGLWILSPPLDKDTYSNLVLLNMFIAIFFIEAAFLDSMFVALLNECF